MKTHSIKTLIFALLLASVFSLAGCTEGANTADEGDTDLQYASTSSTTSETTSETSDMTDSDIQDTSNDVSTSTKVTSDDVSVTTKVTSAGESNGNASDDSHSTDTTPSDDYSSEASSFEGEFVMLLTDITDTKAEFEIINNTDIDTGYGLYPYFQVYGENGWEDIEPLIDIDVPDIYAASFRRRKKFFHSGSCGQLGK